MGLFVIWRKKNYKKKRKNLHLSFNELAVVFKYNLSAVLISSVFFVFIIAGEEGMAGLDVLQKTDDGMEIALERAKVLSKYLQDLLLYVKKKAQLGRFKWT